MKIRDLSSIIESSWSKNALEYAREALSAYSVGAYRACIVATWIAVVYDFIDKMRYLADRNDANAKANLAQLQAALTSSNHRKLLEYEDTVLKWAAVDFQLISTQEQQDLERLREDRNRCAHPALVSMNETYNPSAELARYHLVTALEALLTKDPVHGPSLAPAVMALIDSPTFPTSVADAMRVLEGGPLRRTRHPLLRQIGVVLLKQVLGAESEAAARRYAVALSAVHTMRRVEVETFLADELVRIVDEADAGHQQRLVYLYYIFPDIWAHLGDSTKILVENAVRAATSPITIIAAAGTDALKSAALSRATVLKPSDFALLSGVSGLRPGHLDLVVQAFAATPNFSFGNALVSATLLPLVPQLSSTQVRTLLSACLTNYQVRNLSSFPTLIAKIAAQEGARFRQEVLDLHAEILDREAYDAGHLAASRAIATTYPDSITEVLVTDFLTNRIERVSADDPSTTGTDDLPPEEDLPF